MEVWRPVPSVPGVLVSNEGRVMIQPHFKRGRWYGGTPHFGQWDGNRMIFCWKTIKKTYRIARMVCEAFHGLPPSVRHEAMHLDENSRNNRASNLAWGTRKQNANFPGYLTYCRSRTGESSPTYKHRAKARAQQNEGGR